MQLFQNLLSNFIFLQHDFLGFSINMFGIFHFFSHLILATLFFITYYLLGNKIRKLFFNGVTTYQDFINIALGYIIIGTGIGILGAFSLLRIEVLTLFLFVVLFISLYPFRLRFKQDIYEPLIALKQKITLKNNFIILGVLLFVLISFLRLITPEITEDGYHTDLPTFYLSSGTTMHETLDLQHVIPYPQLADMNYLIAIFLGDKEATRFIHFGMYATIIFLLFAVARNKEYSFAKFAPIIFVTTPLVIRYSPSQYTDLFMLFSFLLSMLLLKKGMSKQSIVLSGVFFGAVLSIKMWMLIYLPAIFLFIYILQRKEQIMSMIKQYLIFVCAALSVVALWYIRAYLITGNPIYPLFSQLSYLGISQTNSLPQSHYFGFNSNLFDLATLAVFSPLFFFAIITSVIFYKEFIKKVGKTPLFLIFLLLSLEELVVKVYLGRYLFAWYTIFAFIISAGILIGVHKQRVIKFSFVGLYFIIFLYYFLNTLFVLPYGFSWADQNKYLTRVLGRDNASYYDFDHQFDRWIAKDDVVATYGIVNFYYANFSSIDAGYIFDEDKKSLEMLRKKKVTKLFIKGGEITWFCKTFAISDCKLEKVTLLATYPSDEKKYNLYSINY